MGMWAKSKCLADIIILASNSKKSAFSDTNLRFCTLGPPQAAGVDFPEVALFWEGEKCRCLGAGVRVKRVAFVGVKVV